MLVTEPSSLLEKLLQDWSAPILEIEGAPYRFILVSTAERDIALRKLLHSTGIDEVFMVSRPSHLDIQLLKAITGSGALLEIFGCAFIPADFTAHEWTPELASQTSAKFALIASEQVKQTLTAAAILFVNMFLFGQLQGIDTHA